MPKDFLGGPVRKKTAATHRRVNFFSATPQVFYWAYIFIAL